MEHKHSPQGSIASSTTSDLLEQSKVASPLSNLEQRAQQDRSRLEGMLEAYKNSSEESTSLTEPVSTTTNEEDYEDADDFIVNRSRPVSQQISFGAVDNRVDEHTLSESQSVNRENTADTIQQEQKSIPYGQDTASGDFAFERPMISQNFNPQSLAMESPTLNRRSVISEYAASIHEADHVVVPTKTQATSSAGRPSIVQISRNPSKSSKKSLKNHEKKLSAMSGDSNTNSGSGSDRYPESAYSGKESHYDAQIPIADATTSPAEAEIIPEETTTTGTNHSHHASTDTFDFDVGPLNTKKEKAVQNVEKEYLTAVDPAIPSRSPRRPVSSTGLKLPVHELAEFGKASRRTKSEQIHGISGHFDDTSRSLTLGDSLENQANVHGVPELEPEITDLQDTETASKQRDVSQPRPLPPPPPPQHRVATPASVKSQPEVEVENIDDGFVTEEDEEKKDKKKKRKSKKRNSTFKKGHFNHDTLVTLLQATEGTIIGQEFQGIGLETQDKQLVERLVDSLSRLTADMIVDGDRREESVKRLNKAIKALEGF